MGIAAKDADAASSLFRELLGLRETARHRVEEFGVLALFLAPREAGAGRLEILEPTRTEGPVGRFLARRGPGLHHLCFEVPDIRAALKALAARGVRLVDREPRPGAGGHLVAFLHPSATAGVLVELKQAAEAPPPARDPPGRGPSPGKDAGRRRGPSAIPTGR